MKETLRKIAYILLCIYFFGICAQYINPIFIKINSLVMYGFIGSSVLLSILDRKIYINKYMIFFFAFMVISGLACFYSPNTSKSLSSMYSMIVCFVLCYCTLPVIKNKNQIEKILYFYSFGSFVLMAYLLVFGKIDFYSSERLGEELMGNANSFALYYMFSAFFSCYFLVYRKKKLRLSSILFLLIQFVAMILSGGRKYPIAVLIVLFSLLFFKTDKKGKKNYVLYSSIGIISFCVFAYLVFNVPFLYENIGYRFKSLLSASDKDASTLTRIDMIKFALSGWLDKPLFGYGYNAFAYLSEWGTYSHNNYTELLFNVGVVGLISYYSLVIWLLFKLFTIRHKDAIIIFMISCSLALLFFDIGAVTYNVVLVQLFYVICNKCIYIHNVNNFSILEINNQK